MLREVYSGVGIRIYILGSDVWWWSCIGCGVQLSRNLSTNNTGAENRLNVLPGRRNPISLSESGECGTVEVTMNIPDYQLGEGILKIWKFYQILQLSIMNLSTAT